MQIHSWELVVGTIAGFITAFLSEPVKTYFVERANQRALRRALYRELAHLYCGWKGLLELMDQGKVRPDQLGQNLWIVNRTDCYAYAKGRPVDYYALQEAATMDSMYRNFMIVGSESLSEPAERLQYAHAALEVFGTNVRRRAIDAQLLLAVANEAQQMMLEDLLGERAA